MVFQSQRSLIDKNIEITTHLLPVFFFSPNLHIVQLLFESTSSIFYIKNETTKQTISFPKVLKKISIPWEFHGTSLSKLKLRELFYEKN